MRRLRRLSHERSLRWEEGVCVIEGPDLIDAALTSGIVFEALYAERSALERPDVTALIARAEAGAVRIFALEARAFEMVAATKTPQPVLAAVRFHVSDLADVPHGLVLVLDNVRDPGNVGTIMRSADAAGAVAIVLSGDCVDPFNPKTLRASAGSVFHVPLALAPLEVVVAHFRERGSRTYATIVRGGTPYRDCDLSGDAVVVIGNEAAGLDDSSVDRCDEAMTIPMAGRSESLNAGVAAALIAFEALHQRSGATRA